MLRLLAGGLSLLGMLILGTACFSDRNATGPGTDACSVTLDPSQFGSTIVAIRDFAFTPTPVHVRAGGTVTWVNCEPAGTPAHTTTADAGAWNSPLLEPGTSYSATFNSAGTFSYHCTPHPSMVAAVVVDP